METIYEKAWYEAPGVLDNRKSAQLDVEVVLSNRRYARVRQMLKELPNGAASAVCRTMIRQGRERCADTMARVLRHYEVPGSPENTVSLLGNKWGMCADLLLAAEFCDTRTVLDAIGEIEKAEQKWLAAAKAKPEVFPASFPLAVEGFACLQPTFKLVTLSLAAHHDQVISQATKVRLDELLAAMVAKTVQLVSWDADITPYDAPTAGGVPVDVTKGAEDIRIYETPTERLTDHAWQKDLLDSVRHLLSADIQRQTQGQIAP
jgi:hypothetical protein